MSEKSLTIPVHKVPLFYGLAKLDNPKTGGICRKHKLTPFMDCKNYLARVRTVPETCPFYGLRKLLFYSAQNPCHWCLPRVRARYLSIN